MRLDAPIILIAVAISGFVTGGLLNDMPQMQTFSVNAYLVGDFFKHGTLSLVKSASLSGSGQAVIDNADIDFTIETFTVDPTPNDPNNSDNYFVNSITQCIFHSDEDIDGLLFDEDSADDGICLVCKFKGEDGVSIIAEGSKNLPLGYTASNDIVIDMLEDPNDPETNEVRLIHGVELNIQSAIIDFDGLNAGDLLTDQYKNTFGIEFFGYKKLSVDQYGNFVVTPLPLMIYDSDPPTGQDPDLEVGTGNISMIPHDDFDNNTPPNGAPDGIPDPIPQYNPNDTPNGGWQVVTFNPPRFVNSLVFIDADRSNAPGMDVVSAYSKVNGAGDDCDETDVIDNNTGDPVVGGDGIPDFLIAGPIQIENEGDTSKQAIVMMNAQKTTCLKVQYMDSGGIDRINLGCPLDGDDLDYDEYTPPPGGSGNILDTTFDEKDGQNQYIEVQNWNFEPDPPRTKTTRTSYIDFGLSSDGNQGPNPQGYYGPHSGQKYLGGSGNIDNLNTEQQTEWAAYYRDALDTSNYDDVVVSFWYSYEDTESADEFQFSYYDGSNWVTIFEDLSPHMPNGQAAWAYISSDPGDIPNDLDSLVLEFRWETSSGSEHIMIDDLQVSGTPE